jgi:obg-like ATPase 1
MPPKKKAEVAKKVILGRASNTLKMGLVGLPNVGKSTTFNTLSNLSVPAENYPFCTIEPTEAKVYVPDKRFERLVGMYNPRSKVAASISIFDIAGLVAGASEGEGLGNAFLSHIQAVDGIFHVVRAFSNEDVMHNEGDVNPIRDLEIITNELFQKDLQHIDRLVEELNRVIARKNNKPDVEERDLLLKCKDMLTTEKKPIRDGVYNGKEIDVLNKHLFMSAKPVVYLVNIGRDEYIAKKNKYLVKIQNWIKENGGGPMVPYSAEFESEVLANAGDAAKEPRDKAAEELGAPTMIHKIVNTGYRALQLIHYFTCGEDEVKCWTIRNGTKAPGAAGVIHTDFEKGFICAEVQKFEDLDRLGSENEVKAEGLYMQKGKEYEVLDGDCIFFKFNVTTKAKKIDKTAGK